MVRQYQTSRMEVVGIILQQVHMYGMTMILAGKARMVLCITGTQLLIQTVFAQLDGMCQQMMNGQH